MKKALRYILNSIIIILSFLIYGVVQQFYIVPKSVPTSVINQRAPWLLAATLVVLMIYWWIYRLQLKVNNPNGYNQKPHFGWRRLGMSLLGFMLLLVWQVLAAILMKGQVSANQTTIESIISNSNWLFNLMIALVAPIFEEIIFRGFVINTFFQGESKWNKVGAILVSGLIFGLMHEPKISLYLLIYWGMGSILAAVYVYTKDLRYSMLVHILNNSLSIL